MDALLGYFSIYNPAMFFIEIIVLAIVIRLVFSWLRAYEYKFIGASEDPQVESFRNLPVSRRFGIMFHGFSKSDPNPDLWYNTILGAIELFAYAIFIGTSNWTAIAIWLGFKAFAKWNVWSTNKLEFNRFILLNAVVILIAFGLAYMHITLIDDGVVQTTP